MTKSVIPTNEFLMHGKCEGCGTEITRYNSTLQNCIRTCVICGIETLNGWRKENDEATN